MSDLQKQEPSNSLNKWRNPDFYTDQTRPLDFDAQIGLVSKEEFEDDKLLFKGHRTLSGQRVSEQTALKQSVVWACVRFLSSSVAQLPWRVFRETEDGEGREVVKNTATSRLTYRRPHPEFGPFNFKERMIKDASTTGNFYGEIVRNGRFEAAAVMPLFPGSMHVTRKAGRLSYEYYDPSGRGRIDYDPMEIFHLRGFGNGIVGLNPIQAAAESIGWARATELFGASFFGNNAMPGGVIEVPADLEISEEGREVMLQEFMDSFGGFKKFRPAILDEGMKWSPNQVNQDEAQFIETLIFQVNQIARYFGVPPHKVNELSKATFSNIEHQAIEVIVDSITPWVIRIEEEANYKFFSNHDELFTKLNVNALMRGDSKARANFYKTMVFIGAMSPNEARAMEDMNPYKGGDVRVMQGQNVPVEQIGKKVSSMPDGQLAPRQPIDEEESEDEDDEE